MSCSIRPATPADGAAILALALRDGVASPAGEVLAAEGVRGEIVAAIAVRDGRLVGDAAACGTRLREHRTRALKQRYFHLAA